ncbi:hypothetical protein [Deinococcus sp. PEB2-63]
MHTPNPDPDTQPGSNLQQRTRGMPALRVTSVTLRGQPIDTTEGQIALACALLRIPIPRAEQAATPEEKA